LPRAYLKANGVLGGDVGVGVDHRVSVNKREELMEEVGDGVVQGDLLQVSRGVVQVGSRARIGEDSTQFRVEQLDGNLRLRSKSLEDLCERIQRPVFRSPAQLDYLFCINTMFPALVKIFGSEF